MSILVLPRRPTYLACTYEIYLFLTQYLKDVVKVFPFIRVFGSTFTHHKFFFSRSTSLAMTTQDENLRFLIKSSLLPVILSFSFLSLALWNIEPEQSKTIEKDFCHSGFDNSCSSSTSTSKWNWELDDPHRCNIEKISLSQLPLHFPPLGVLPPLYYKPIIIVDDTQQRNSKFQDITSKDGILEALTPSFPITLSSSNSFSDYRRTTTLEQYINETIISETLPNHLSNESWYVMLQI